MAQKIKRIHCLARFWTEKKMSQEIFKEEFFSLLLMSCSPLISKLG